MTPYPTDCLSMPSASIGPSEARSASDWCPCGSRCDGHAVAAPEDPGVEWDGVADYLPGWESCPNCGYPVHMSHNGWSSHRMVCPVVLKALREETSPSDRSPREEWVSAWQAKRETHR